MVREETGKGRTGSASLKAGRSSKALIKGCSILSRQEELERHLCPEDAGIRPLGNSNTADTG